MSRLIHSTPTRPGTPQLLRQEDYDLLSPSQTISQILRPSSVERIPPLSPTDISYIDSNLNNHQDQQVPPPPAIDPLPQTDEFREAPKRNSSGKTGETNWFLTYPQNETLKSTVLERLQALSYGLVWAIVSQETHKDGQFHLHVALKFRTRVQVRDLNSIFDPIGGKHGDYRRIKSIPHAIAYCQKEDPDPLVFGTLPKGPKTKPPRKMDTIARELMEGQSIKEIAKREPGLVLQNLQKMQTFQAMMKALGVSRTTLTHQVTLTFQPSGNEAERKLHEWLANNIPNRNRPHKQAQLYLQANTNHQKTRLVTQKLGQFLKFYPMPLSEQYDNLYNDDAYDGIVLDEFSKGTKRTVQFINQFVEGSPCPVPIKNGQLLKEVNLPVIILSNFEPAEFWKDGQMPLFESRFTHIKLTQPLDLDLIQITATPLSSSE